MKSDKDIKYINVLKEAGVIFEAGLSDDEIFKIEKEYQFIFPPDYKSFLQTELPVTQGFIDWRNAKKETIQERLNWPYDGMCFDIENNNFWMAEWGNRPSDNIKAFEIAKKAINNAPKLIPILGHRYIPDNPNEINNPIFSVYQTDIIYYGIDFYKYLENEFHFYFKTKEYQLTGDIKRINFWSKFTEDLV